MYSARFAIGDKPFASHESRARNKIGKFMPGTQIPVVEESKLFTDQPECAVIFSWHIADELAPKLKAKGYRGRLMTPLPLPRYL